MGNGEGCPPPQRTGLGDRRELHPQRGSRRSPGRQCIFGIFEAHRTAHKSSIFRKRSTRSIDCLIDRLSGLFTHVHWTISPGYFFRSGGEALGFSGGHGPLCPSPSTGLVVSRVANPVFSRRPSIVCPVVCL